MFDKEKERSSSFLRALLQDVSAELERNPHVSRVVSEFHNATRDITGISAYPPIDVFEEPGKVIIFADLPGVRKNSIKITLLGDALTISAVRQTEDTEGTVLKRERSERLHRRIILPIHVEEGDIPKTEHELKDGVLKFVVYNKQANVINLVDSESGVSSQTKAR